MTAIIKKTGKGGIYEWEPMGIKKEDFFKTIRLVSIPTPMKMPDIPEPVEFLFMFKVHLN